MLCPCHPHEFSLRLVQSFYYLCDSATNTSHTSKFQNLRQNALSQETCLASKDAMSFDLLKKRLMYRLNMMGVRILKVYEEVRSKGSTILNLSLIYSLKTNWKMFLVSGMVLHSCWRVLTKHRSEKSCIWCCSKYGASCNRYRQIINFSHTSFFLAYIDNVSQNP